MKRILSGLKAHRAARRRSDSGSAGRELFAEASCHDVFTQPSVRVCADPDGDRRNPQSRPRRNCRPHAGALAAALGLVLHGLSVSLNPTALGERTWSVVVLGTLALCSYAFVAAGLLGLVRAWVDPERQ